MPWISENPWPLIMILSGVAVVLLILGESRMRSLAVAFALMAVGLYFLEAWIVTPAEHVESRLGSLLDQFKSENLSAIGEHIDDGSPKLRETAEQGLKLVMLDKGFHLQDLKITVAPDGQSANAELRANGTMTVRQASTPYHASTRWKTRWLLRGDAWKLSEVERLNPVTGEEIGILEAQ
jgi:hypothetical protein